MRFVISFLSSLFPKEYYVSDLEDSLAFLPHLRATCGATQPANSSAGKQGDLVRDGRPSLVISSHHDLGEGSPSLGMSTNAIRFTFT
jgi:hypothetical protein